MLVKANAAPNAEKKAKHAQGDDGAERELISGANYKAEQAEPNAGLLQVDAVDFRVARYRLLLEAVPAELDGVSLMMFVHGEI